VHTADQDRHLLTSLRQVLGSEQVLVAESERRLLSEDVYRAGEVPVAVVRPRSTAEVASAVRVTIAAGYAVYIRGGGMSYTDAYLPDRSDAVILDMTGLAAVREINAEDLYATVEAGCTWAALDEALAPHGVRSVFWGPMSGRVATVGGAMSQGAATFGSGRHGPSSATALGFEVVLADGRVLETGASGQPQHQNFFRYYGPDLTGLLTGDAGALGVKTAVTVQLEPRPKLGDGLSFAFDDFTALAAAVGRIARDGLATEVFGAETALARKVADASTFKSDLKTLWAVGQAAHNPITGVKRMLKIAANGRRFLQDSRYTISFLTEAESGAELRRTLRGIRAAVGDDGYEIPNTMATITRATPFPDPMVLGPGGRRLLPLHGIIPFSAAESLHQAVTDYLAQQSASCEQHEIEIYLVYSTLGRSAFLYELVIYWPDAWNDLHRATLSPELLKLFHESEPRPAARELVDRVKTELVELMYQHGATHLQIGRLYPYTRERNQPALDVLGQIKREIDPLGLINPGALGL
jgi:FAD/FMN-containing dehydrogenase